MYKTESTLGLVGSIIGAVFTFLFAVGTLIAMFFYSYFEPVINNIINRYVPDFFYYGYTHETVTSLVIPVIAICAVVAAIIAAASVILGFVGTAKLGRDDKSGGVLLIVGGALALISVVGFIPFVLMLVGGIMAVSKKPAIAAQPGLNKTV